MASALASPLAELPDVGTPALRQVDRAIGDVLSHHAHVRLHPAA